MKRKRAAFLCAVALVCLGIVLGRALLRWRTIERITGPAEDIVMGVRLVKDESHILSKERQFSEENTMIVFDEVPVPYDTGTNTLYLSQSLEGWTGQLSVLADEEEEAYYLCSPVSEMWTREQEAIKEGHVFTLWAVNDQNYYEFNLVISGMPVINIQTEYMEVQEEIPYEVDPDKRVYGSEDLYYGSISVFNPDVAVDSYEILESRVCYHQKGISSVVFEKRGYSLKLLDYDGQNVNDSLLGMREDQSWKLNALNTDVNRIREITASQIWEYIDAADVDTEEPGPRMEYVELLMDGDYRGLYCLVEPVDQNQLNLDENDPLYKIIGWEVPESDKILESAEMGWKIQKPIRLRYPKEIKDYEEAWYPINDYLETFYRTPEIDYETSVQKVDIHNQCDYFIFLMTISGLDNTFKNIYFTADMKEDGSYVMRIIPWDLDYSFGNMYSYGALNDTCLNEDYTGVYAEAALPQLKRANPDKVEQLLLTKWNSYRESFLSMDFITELFEKNQTYIIETGALQREAERWPEAGVTADTEALMDYQTKRMAWLDEYMIKWFNE